MSSPPENDDHKRDPQISSRLIYAIAGAVGGGAFGVVGMGRSNSPDLSGTEPLLILALTITAGTLVGLQLHETQSWSRIGEWGTLARWVVAFLSTAATIGAIFLVLGGLSRNEYFSALGFAALVGFLFGMEALRLQSREEESTASPRNAGKGIKKYREATSPADAQSRFVWVDNDGSIRDLTSAECDLLATPFRPFDGGRPYVKDSYDARTPDNRQQGFLERTKIPQRLKGKRKSR